MPRATCHTPHPTRRTPHTAHHLTLPAIHTQPHASRCLASTTQQVSRSSMQEHTWEHIVKWDWECTIECNWESTWEQLGGVLGSVFRAYLGADSQAGWECAIKCNRECAWEHSWECAWDRLVSVLGSVQSIRLRVSSSAIGSVLEAMLGSVLESFLRAYLVVYSHAGWECAIECSWERLWEHSRECAWERLESVQLSKIAVCHREELGASLRVYPEVYLGATWELTGECESSKLGSVSLRANGSILESMPGCNTGRFTLSPNQ